MQRGKQSKAQTIVKLLHHDSEHCIMQTSQKHTLTCLGLFLHYTYICTLIWGLLCACIYLVPTLWPMGNIGILYNCCVYCTRLSALWAIIARQTFVLCCKEYITSYLMFNFMSGQNVCLACTASYSSGDILGRAELAITCSSAILFILSLFMATSSCVVIGGEEWRVHLSPIPAMIMPNCWYYWVLVRD